MSAYKQKIDRKLYIDFTDYEDPRSTLGSSYPASQLVSVIGPRRQFGTPEQLRRKINEYFASCLGQKFSKFGVPITDPSTGEPLITVVRPYTLSGLARHLGVTTQALKEYKFNSIRRGIDDEFLPILDDARQRIEEYMEQNLYSGEAGRGAQFALSAAFGWETPKERSERITAKVRADMARDEHRFKMEQYERGEVDTGFTINIVRAGQNLPAYDDNIVHLNADDSEVE